MMMWEIADFLWGNFYDIVTQSFGILGIWVLLFAFYQKDDIKSMKLVTVAIIVWMIHYFMLGGMEWAIYASIIGLIRMYCSFKYKWSRIALYSVIGLTLVFWIVSYDGVISTLPIIASLIAILAFQVFHWIKMRLALLICSFLRLYYMIVQWSVPWIINEILVEIILITTIIRIYITESEEYSFPKSLLQKIKYKLSRKHPRRRVDFWKFIIFRDKKKYFEENAIEYAEK